MLLHTYYDWQLVERFPLRMLGELLSAARKREESIEKEKADKMIAALWFARVAIDTITGSEPVDFDEFQSEITKKDEPTKKRSAEEIMAEMMPLINAERG